MLMAMARFEAEKFTGKNDFGLWRLKMKALLIQHGLADALTPDKDGAEEPSAKQVEIAEKAHNAIILSLDDKVLREVSKETTAAGIWNKLEELYMVKSLANRLYLKQRLYAFRFSEDRSIGEQLDQFNKYVDDLENIDVELDDEDKAIILLAALPRSFEQLKDAMLYGREKSITFVEVQSALKTKEFQKSNGGQEVATEVLNVKKSKQSSTKGKNVFPKPQPHKGKEKFEGKETRSCHYCKKPGHIKKNCFA